MGQNDQPLARSSTAKGKMSAHELAILRQVCPSPDTNIQANSLSQAPEVSKPRYLLLVQDQDEKWWKKKHLVGHIKVHFQISENLYIAISVSNKVFQHY